MAKIHRSRVAAVGSEYDMQRLARVMLENGDWLPETEGPPLTLEALLAEVAHRAQWEAGESCGFLPRMICRTPYAQLISERCALKVERHPSGLMTALFTFDSWDVFQPEDWLALHQQCGRLPMFALHADEDFSREKGGVIYTGGAYYEDWDRMAETWLWLWRTYYAGKPPEEARDSLRRLDALLSQEWDQRAAELLESCRVHLHRVETSAAQVTAEALQEAQEQRDYPHLFAMQRALADARLWDVAHSARWQACLESDLAVCSPA